MASNSATAGAQTYEITPENIRCQYVDPRPKLEEGERLINKTLEVILGYMSVIITRKKVMF